MRINIIYTYRLILVSICFTIPLQGQVINQSGNLFSEVSSIINNMPGNSGNHYANPTSTELDTWSNIITLLVNENYTLAATYANTIGYDLIEYSDTAVTPNKTYYVLKSNATNYWGTYIFNPNACNALVIQSPHPKHDFNTGKQGIHVFKETNALFFCLSGTHRCNNSQFSSCDGTTSSCATSPENYRISDLAHTNNSIFQKTTEVLFNAFNNTYFIQLHGFTKLTTDPYLIISNGTRETPTIDYLSQFQSQLFNEDNSLTFKTAHIDLTWSRLIGFTNTQGRLINSSTNFCGANASNTNGRFFHIEQEKTKLRDNVTGWNKVANALNSTFPCNTLSNGERPVISTYFIYPNPAAKELKVTGPDLNIKNIKVYNLKGQELTKYIKFIRIGNTIKINISTLANGTYVIKSKNFSKIVLKK